MKTKRLNIFRRKLAALLMLVCFLSCMSVAALAADGSELVNRFNVVVVLDASTSMEKTDPAELRFEAVSQFVNLLADEGNYLGCVVFSTDNVARHEVEPADSASEKDEVVDCLRSAGLGDWTNIGAGLKEAVRMLVDDGDPDLPSVILLLSDGNTEMSTSEEVELSYEMKADAIMTARENDISVYSVCLNANNKADTSEMQQIADATAGVFEEVKTADDIQDIFNAFYGMIYGTSSVTIVDDCIPSDGVLETEFDVPGFGVEEINIIIYGNVDSAELVRPDGEMSSASVVQEKTFTLLKASDVESGTWTLYTSGSAGENIQVNMVYNTDMTVDISLEPESGTVEPQDFITVTGTLKNRTETATTDKQYTGYTMELVVVDAFDNTEETYPMTYSDGCFTFEQCLEDGAYNFYIRVYGNYLEKFSETVGPLRVDGTGPVPTPVPPPHANDNPVKIDVSIWPIVGGKAEVDLTTLATNDQNNELHYRIASSAFIEGTDYTVTDNILTMDHFSLKKGNFIVVATDDWGESCEIEIIVTTHNIATITLIALGAAAALVLIGFGVYCYRTSLIPFRGIIKCSVGYGSEMVERKPKKGRYKLSNFHLERLEGIDYTKWYFQATGNNYVYLCAGAFSGQVIYAGGHPTKKLKISSNSPVEVRAQPNAQTSLKITFHSVMLHPMR